MLVTLGEQKILTLADFADLASDELTGGYDVIKGERIRTLANQVTKLDDENIKLCENIEVILLKNRLITHSLEEWIGKSLKFHYLLKEIDKIGLQQSEYILDAYKDIDMPIDEIPIHIRDKYIPTMLTNMVELESSDEEL